MFLMSAIAWRVGELARQRGLTVRVLARASGLDEKTVRNIVAGRATRVDLDTIARLAGALGVGPGALWSMRPDPLQAWSATAGSAGRARPDELARALEGDASVLGDPGLERALRSP
jgi:DNA-binding Xre family transcriptional regulator